MKSLLKSGISQKPTVANSWKLDDLISILQWNHEVTLCQSFILNVIFRDLSPWGINRYDLAKWYWCARFSNSTLTCERDFMVDEIITNDCKFKYCWCGLDKPKNWKISSSCALNWQILSLSGRTLEIKSVRGREKIRGTWDKNVLNFNLLHSPYFAFSLFTSRNYGSIFIDLVDFKL